MKKWLAGALIIAALLSWGMWQRVGKIRAEADAAFLRDQLATAEIARDQAQEADRVHRAHLDRLERENERWAGIEADLRNMGGRDVPLSPLLRAASGRLWPQP